MLWAINAKVTAWPQVGGGSTVEHGAAVPCLATMTRFERMQQRHFGMTLLVLQV
jgi:hypothetical protein